MLCSGHSDPSSLTIRNARTNRELPTYQPTRAVSSTISCGENACLSARKTLSSTSPLRAAWSTKRSAARSRVSKSEEVSGATHRYWPPPLRSEARSVDAPTAHKRSR
jgi:hypothetical protein